MKEPIKGKIYTTRNGSEAIFCGQSSGKSYIFSIFENDDYDYWWYDSPGRVENECKHRLDIPELLGEKVTILWVKKTAKGYSLTTKEPKSGSFTRIIVIEDKEENLNISS